MGGSANEALTFDLQNMLRWLEFADMEEEVNQAEIKRAEQNAKP